MTAEPICPEDTNTHQGFYDNGGLSNFHRVDLPEKTSRTARLTGFAVVVLVVIGAAVYGYMSGGGPPAPNNFFAKPAAVKSAAANKPSPVQTAPAAPSPEQPQ